MTATRYMLVHGDWLDKARTAIENGDGDAALMLLTDLAVMPRKPYVDKNGRVKISTLGLSIGTCAQCMHYDKDPDPIDPGWPMMCKVLGIDMLEPYATCWFCDPKRELDSIQIALPSDVNDD